MAANLSSTRFESGAAKRRKQKRQDDVIRKTSKLTKYFEAPVPLDSSQCSSTAVQLLSENVPNVLNTETTIDCVSEQTEHHGNSPQTIDLAVEMTTPGMITCESSSLDVTAECNPDNDISKWIITEGLREYCVKMGPCFCANRDGLYSASLRTQTVKPNNKKSQTVFSRKLPETVFTRTMRNGDKVDRDWLVYSPITGCIYCFVCKLFSTKRTAMSETGLDDWRHVTSRVGEHEKSIDHLAAVQTWVARKQIYGKIDTALELHVENERVYWENVLKRVVRVVKLLAERGLPFRGTDEVIGSPHNGVFLGVLETVADFDPFLARHLTEYGNAGSGKSSYLSSTIYEELVKTMGAKVFETILHQIREAKYYSISIDSTPDISHIDQLTFVFRYVEKNTHLPRERFLTYLPISQHTGESLSNKIVGFLEDNNIDLLHCRGQSYDNASNMSGPYQGVQARIRDINPLALYVPCAGHSLNLVGQRAAETCTAAVSYFGFVQRLYTFLSSSTRRWKVLLTRLSSIKDHIGSHGLVVKSLSETRWSARHDAIRALHIGYIEINNVLIQISADENHPPDARSDAGMLQERMDMLETVLLTEIWYDVLNRFEKTSSSLQSTHIDLKRVTSLLESLADYIEGMRDQFADFERIAKEKSILDEYSDIGKRKRIRNKVFQHESSAEEVSLSGSDKFREVFLPIIDSLISAISKRSEAYKKTNEKFAFLTCFDDMTTDELLMKSQQLLQEYHVDFDDSFPTEMVQFAHFAPSLVSVCKGKSACASNLLSAIFTAQVESTFPNVVIALRIFLTLMCTNCTGERSFSKLKLLKSKLRSTMTQERLNNLAIMSIENDILRSLDFTDIIKEFSIRKSRKK